MKTEADAILEQFQEEQDFQFLRQMNGGRCARRQATQLHFSHSTFNNKSFKEYSEPEWREAL